MWKNFNVLPHILFYNFIILSINFILCVLNLVIVFVLSFAMHVIFITFVLIDGDPSQTSYSSALSSESSRAIN